MGLNITRAYTNNYGGDSEMVIKLKIMVVYLADVRILGKMERSIFDLYCKPYDKKGSANYIGLIRFYTQCIPALQLTLDPSHNISGKSEIEWGEEL